MKVKSYIVENYQLLMDYLEEELCKNGISYVRIDNEIHFLDQIIRFFDFEIDREMIIIWGLGKYEEFLDIQDRFTLANLSFDDVRDYVPEIIYIRDDKCYQRRNKFIKKQESNQVNQKLKKYSR